MGKRSSGSFERIEKDAYMTTDPRAVRPLLDYYQDAYLHYYEPCVGNRDLVRLLEPIGKVVASSDVELDARTTTYNIGGCQYFITNPPWSRELLHPIIHNLRRQLPTWLLFDSDWMLTAQSNPYMKFCKVVLPVGRLKWIPGSGHTGKDNCAWYLFVDYETPCTFIPKLSRQTRTVS